MQAAGIALTYCTELPLGAVAVDLGEDHGGLCCRVLREVVADNLSVTVLIDHAAERVPNLTEVLPAGLCLIDGDHDDDPFNFGGHGVEIDEDLLVVAVAFTGAVVT